MYTEQKGVFQVLKVSLSWCSLGSVPGISALRLAITQGKYICEILGQYPGLEI